MRLNSRRLGYFVTVADEGQITRAAKKLNLAQPALSQAMATLESELGFQLLERNPRGVSLTPAGEVFLERARRVVQASADLAGAARVLQQGVAGTVTFGYLGLPPWQAMPDVVELLERTHPEIEISLEPLGFPSSPISSWLVGVDVVLYTGPVAVDPEVWVQPLGVTSRVVVMSHGHPLAKRTELGVGEVLGEVFIGFDAAVDPEWAGAWNLGVERGGLPQRLADKVPDSVQGRLAMIAAGSGLSTALADMAPLLSTALTGLVMIPLRGAKPVSLSLVGRLDRLSPAVEALLAAAQIVRKVDGEESVAAAPP